MDGGVPSTGNYFTRPKSGATTGDELMPQILNNRAQSKGKLYKGTPFAYLKSSVEDKARIQDLMSTLEDNNQQILL